MPFGGRPHIIAGLDPAIQGRGFQRLVAVDVRVDPRVGMTVSQKSWPLLLTGSKAAIPMGFSSRQMVAIGCQLSLA
jgi:hypothetical protein